MVSIGLFEQSQTSYQTRETFCWRKGNAQSTAKGEFEVDSDVLELPELLHGYCLPHIFVTARFKGRDSPMRGLDENLEVALTALRYPT